MNFVGLGPSLIICPSTLLRQWVKEIHTWMPLCRVALFHSSGNFKGSRRALVSKMAINRKGGSILITTYSTFHKYSSFLLPQAWHYVVLDEGHKIRNPKAQISEAVKQLHTPCRLILTGTPLQNSLIEIWSLMDFVYAGKLNSLDTFTEKFAVPITQGGYANATKQQLLTAYKCATVLRDAISPFILRRVKKSVQKSLELPEKNEKVLFCELSSEQRRLYLDYLQSRECKSILKGRLDAFIGLTILRKLCNHPDLITGGPNRHGDFDESEDPSKAFGFCDRSGKMRVLFQLLELWQANKKEKVLIFSQSREMLDIIERKLQNDGYSHLRMDGNTAIGSRQKKIERFNEDPEIFIFLLTTKVGGIGLNLTAANKVIIFDPDWNPSTDTQAKERSWRIGQERSVTIYRLLCAGTIEEKIYHRQIFKQFLANRILKDPKQRQFFKSNDLHDLFSFTDVHKDALTETGSLFASETDEIRSSNFFNSDAYKKHEEKSMKTRKSEDVCTSERAACASASCELSEAKKDELRKRAKLLSRKLGCLTSNEAEVVDNSSTQEINTFNKSECSPSKKVKVGDRRKKQLTESIGPSSSKLIPSKASNRGTEEDAENSATGKSSDDFVLNCLLHSAGVRCAIEHDDLVGEKSSNYLIEKEASLVANRAANALGKRSNMSFVRQFRAPFSSSLEDKPIYASSSKSLPFQGGGAKDSILTALHARKRKLDETLPSDIVVRDKYVKIAEKIQNFMRRSGGRAFSETITENFKSVFEENKAEFRAIVWKLCELDPLKREWHLRPEYW
ncbi:hypothetical protein KIN20_009804 [Parelaphostrongylus tenuis]|nr:hypothetical protein KIN20_009804 [Parelaphostrongylus tenuis]